VKLILNVDNITTSLCTSTGSDYS